MEKIRDLKCMDINGTKDASLWINDYGEVFYDNGVDVIPYREIGHLYGCESCMHFRDKSYKEDFTQNNFYHLKPLNYPPLVNVILLIKNMKIMILYLDVGEVQTNILCVKTFVLIPIKILGMIIILIILLI